jgi:hypothetical protein
MSAPYRRLPKVGSPAPGAELVLAAGLPQGDWAARVPRGMLPPALWWEASLRGRLPRLGAPWSARLIPAGVWMFRGNPTVDEAARAARVPADPERLAVVVGGVGPEPATLDAVTRLLAVLPDSGPRAVRLFLPGVGPQLGRGLAADCGLDLVAAPAALRTHGDLTWVADFDAGNPTAFRQWYRTEGGGPTQPWGAAYPPPSWEPACVGYVPQQGLAAALVHRIPAGFAVRPLGAADDNFLAFAAGVAPSAERLQLAVQAVGMDPLVMAACTELLDSLPTAATRQVQLVWPYAGTREAAGLLADLSATLEAPVVAPAAGIGTHRNGHDLLAVHGDGALGHWVRFSADQQTPHGPLSPPPGWGPSLAGALGSLPRTAAPVVLAPAGLHLRGGEAGPDQSALAAALAPERDGVTVLADGDALHAADRDRVVEVLAHLDSTVLGGLRLVMHAACDGTHPFAQTLANRLQLRVLAATTESISGPGHTGAATPVWQRFLPRPVPGVVAVHVPPPGSPAEPPVPVVGPVPAFTAVPEYTDPRPAVRSAIRAGRFSEAAALAADWERHVLRSQGPRAPALADVAETQAQIAVVAGQLERGCSRWIAAAQSRLLWWGPDDDQVLAAVDNAHYLWRRLSGEAAVALGPALVELRRRVPDEGGRRRAPVERRLGHLQALWTPGAAVGAPDGDGGASRPGIPRRPA